MHSLSPSLMLSFNPSKSNIFSKFGKSARLSILISTQTNVTPSVNPTIKPSDFPSEFYSFMKSHIISLVSTAVHILSPYLMLYFNPSKGLSLSPSKYHSYIPGKIDSIKPNSLIPRYFQQLQKTKFSVDQ